MYLYLVTFGEHKTTDVLVSLSLYLPYLKVAQKGEALQSMEVLWRPLFLPYICTYCTVSTVHIGAKLRNNQHVQVK